jgi:hypothetical protein
MEDTCSGFEGAEWLKHFKQSPIHSYLSNITPEVTTVHVILRTSAGLTWMRDNRELV